MGTKALLEWDLGHSLHRHWHALARDWRRSLRADGKSDATIRIYLTAVRHLVAWLIAEDDLCTADEVTRSRIRGWVAHMIETRSAATANTNYRAIRPFFAWLIGEGVIPRSPMEGTRQPKTPDKPIPVIRDREMTKLLNACAGRGFLALRDRAIIRLLADTGVRRGEIAGLDVVDVDLDYDFIRVTGKGGHVRTVPFGAKTGRALTQYLRTRETHKLATLPALWLGASSRGRLSPVALGHMLTRRGTAAGVEGLHTHQFRHTFAHTFRKLGGNDSDLKRLGGWKSDAMLERYGRSAADERAHEAHRRLAIGDRY
ncbi:site-specific recombinase XerD [Saccharothrix saharensis]|uniref:Site-specific recombinase XerD n=1 Tax=Saccharothrix saharensis TaxID=571190 RepID=A0A543JFW6_9PSEU|nr:site-specific recombinase XerD [Saccharothrix saharensis]